MFVTLLISICITAIIFYMIGWYLNSTFGKKSIKGAKDKEKEIIDNATIEAENLKKEKLLKIITPSKKYSSLLKRFAKYMVVISVLKDKLKVRSKKK